MPTAPARRHLAPVLVAVVVSLGVPTLLGACGGGGSANAPAGISDGATGPTLARPSWLPAQFPGPPGGVIVEVIDRPDTSNEDITYGRTVTWRVDKPYDDVLRDVDAIIASQGWTPTDRLSASSEDTRRTSIYLENGTLEVVRIYVDDNLQGVRVTAELPS